MNSRELVFRTLRGEETPCAASGPLAVHFCARDRGVSLKDYSLSAQTLADCVVRYYEKYKPDAVWLSADTWITAQAAGAPVTIHDGDDPIGGSQDGFIQSIADLQKLVPPDPFHSGRQPLMLDAALAACARAGRRRFVLSSGCTLAPDTPGANLRALIDAARDWKPITA